MAYGLKPKQTNTKALQSTYEIMLREDGKPTAFKQITIEGYAHHLTMVEKAEAILKQLDIPYKLVQSLHDVTNGTSRTGKKSLGIDLSDNRRLLCYYLTK